MNDNFFPFFPASALAAVTLASSAPGLATSLAASLYPSGAAAEPSAAPGKAMPRPANDRGPCRPAVLGWIRSLPGDRAARIC